MCNLSSVSANVFQGISPNDRRFGVDSTMFRNVGEGLAAAVFALALSTLSIGYAYGQYSAGKAFTATAAYAGAGIMVSILIGGIVFLLIKE